jgi:hypothetical protein
MKSNKDIINEEHKGLIKDNGVKKHLFSFEQVINLMNLARKDSLTPPNDVCQNCDSGLCEEEIDEGECFNCGTKIGLYIP